MAGRAAQPQGQGHLTRWQRIHLGTLIAIALIITAIAGGVAWIWRQSVELIKVIGFLFAFFITALVWLCLGLGRWVAVRFGYLVALWNLRGETFFVYSEKKRFKSFIEDSLVPCLPPELNVERYVELAHRSDVRRRGQKMSHVVALCKLRGRAAFPLVVHVSLGRAHFQTVVADVEMGVAKKHDVGVVAQRIASEAHRLSGRHA